MLKLFAFLAQFDPIPLDEKPTKGFTSGAADALLIIGSALILGLILCFWVYLTRKERRRHSSPSLNSEMRPSRSGPSEDQSVRRVRVRRHRRRRRGEEFPRNPTLGETGGLPPLRPEEEPEPPQ